MNIENFVQLFYKAEDYLYVNLIYFNVNIKLIKSMIIFKISKMNIMLITFYIMQKHCYNQLIKQKS